MLMKTPNEILAADLLEKAAEIMKQRGRCIADLTIHTGQVCMLGALAAAEFGDPMKGINEDSEFILSPLAKIGAKAMLLYDAEDVWRFNDDSSTTDDMVLSRLNIGALVLRSAT